MTDKTTSKEASTESSSDFKVKDFTEAYLGKADDSEKTVERYEFLDEIGRGGQGRIGLVKDRVFNRYSAMKVLEGASLEDEKLIAQFLDEALMSSQLQHPNIIPVYDVGVTDICGGGTYLPFYTMPLVEGESLEKVLAQISLNNKEYLEEYNLTMRIEIFSKICNAIDYSHSHNVLHRDIKPDNILVGHHGEVLLINWGLAQKIDELMNSDRDQDIIEGSPSYLSPEQASGETLDIRTDIFLLGSTLYHLLTLQAPYNEPNAIDKLNKALAVDFVHPHRTSGGKFLASSLVDIIMKAMDPDPDKRYQSVYEMKIDLWNYTRKQTISKHKIIKKGQCLIREGDTDQQTYVILEGAVDVFKDVMNREHKLASLGQGEIVGEMAAICKASRSSTVEATEDCDLLVIEKEVLEEQLRDQPPWMSKIVTSMASRLERMEAQQHPYLILSPVESLLRQVLYVSTYFQKETDLSSCLYARVLRECVSVLGLPYKTVKDVCDAAINSTLLDLTQGNRLSFSAEKLFGFVEYLKREREIEDRFSLPSFEVSGLKDFTEYARIHELIEEQIFKYN